MNFSYEVKTSLLVAYDFGFELINSYTQTGQLETASTNAMFRMYIFPSLFKTWVIGDGLWMDSFGRFLYAYRYWIYTYDILFWNCWID